MNRYARYLFTVAALFNVIVAASLLLAWPQMQQLLQLAPAEGSNRLLVNLCGVLVLTFGYAYYMAGRDPVRYRPYIVLGVIGKMLVVATALPGLVTGRQGYLLGWLTMGDLIFAALFVDFLLKRSSPPGPILGRR